MPAKALLLPRANFLSRLAPDGKLVAEEEVVGTSDSPGLLLRPEPGLILGEPWYTLCVYGIQRREFHDQDANQTR